MNHLTRYWKKKYESVTDTLNTKDTSASKNYAHSILLHLYQDLAWPRFQGGS